MVGHKLQATAGDRAISVDGRDVAAWAGRRWDGAADDTWAVTAEQYVAAHPRAGRMGEAQRLALLRRLAAGPATQSELLAAMRRCGYVGGDDFENRMRELRAGDTRAAGRSGQEVASDGGRWWLAEPFPLMDAADRRALGFAMGMIERVDSPMAARASSALERMLPGVGHLHADAAPRQLASPADFERFHSAMEQRRPVRVRYFSLNRGRPGTYDLVPIEYVTLGPTVKAMCVQVSDHGRARDRELQFALDRLLSVEELAEWETLPADQLHLQRATLVLAVTDPLYRVMRDRNLFGIAAGAEAVQDPTDDSWKVTGSFPVALAWDVMEQLCAWAGNAQVWEPYWLVNAVVRRLRAGLRVMQDGAEFTLVKPETDRPFASHGEALTTEDPLPEPTGPRKLAPRD